MRLFWFTVSGARARSSFTVGGFVPQIQQISIKTVDPREAVNPSEVDSGEDPSVKTRV